MITRHIQALKIISSSPKGTINDVLKLMFVKKYLYINTIFDHSYYAFAKNSEYVQSVDKTNILRS